VREAEHDTIFNEYQPRIGEIINATVKRIEGPDVIMDIGKAEARMGKKEQSRLESFAVGERVRVVLLRVVRPRQGRQVVVCGAQRRNLFSISFRPRFPRSTTVPLLSARSLAKPANARKLP